ncbi:MAG: DUF4397 domain-containing protein [Acidobacteriota bacterium]|nr:DUF4397 domain-containing protein [Acidobacteriota bacterium]
MKRKIGMVSLIVVGTLVLTAGTASADSHMAMVSVGHGIPGDDLGLDPALPVDVIVDGGCLLQDLEFGQFAGPLELAPNTYTVAVALSDNDPLTCVGPVVIGPVDLTFNGGDNATIFAHLLSDGGITASVYDNDVSNVVAGKTRLTVRHTAWAPAVDITLNRGWMRGRLIAEIKGLENPLEAGPLDVRPGSYAVSIFPANGDEAVSRVQPFVTNPGVSQIVYAVGSLENMTFTLLVQTFDLEFTPPRRAKR